MTPPLLLTCANARKAKGFGALETTAKEKRGEEHSAAFQTLENLA
jgi:hypothetical protein